MVTTARLMTALVNLWNWMKTAPVWQFASIGGAKLIYNKDRTRLVAVQIWDDREEGGGAEGCGVSNTLGTDKITSRLR